MDFEMQKANLLAENIKEFIKLVYRYYENESNIIVNKEKLYHIKLLIEEHKFSLLSDELIRINTFSWDEKYTSYLVDKFQTGLTIIDEYVTYHDNDLFIISARVYTLKNLCTAFSKVMSSPPPN